MRSQQENQQNTTDNTAKKQTKKRVVSILLAAALVGAGFGGGYLTSYLSIDGGLRSIMWAKDTIDREYKGNISDDEFYTAIFETINSLLDDYSYYMTKEGYAELQKSWAGEWSGLGLEFSTLDAAGNDQIYVAYVAGNSPAYFAGVKEGSHLRFLQKSGQEAFYPDDYDDFKEYMLSCEKGEPVTIGFELAKTGEDYTVSVAKDTFVQTFVHYRTAESGYSFTGKKGLTFTQDGNALPQLDGETAYIRLKEFNGGAVEQFDRAMAQFAADGKKNLILDLRVNVGGNLDVLSGIAKYFCKNATGVNPVVVHAEYGNGRKQSFRATGNVYDEYFSSDSKICVVADHNTASASESLIGCMLDYGAIGYGDIYLCERAEWTDDGQGGLVCNQVAKTYGKGIMQTTFLRNYFGATEAIKLTTADILWPLTKKSIHGVGVTTADGASKVGENGLGDDEIASVIQMFLNKS